MVLVASRGLPPIDVLRQYTDNSEVRLRLRLRFDGSNNKSWQVYCVQEASGTADVSIQFGSIKGEAFRVHSVLLKLAFPAFANMDFRPGSRISIVGSSEEEVNMMIELAYGYGRSV
jgi:hypothetical protein